jgi:GNAT superfamily N-acetyltransferase
MIREIAENELGALLDLYRDLHETDSPLPAADVVEALWRTIRSSENLKYFGVFENGGLVSSCTLSVIPNLTRGCRPYGVIENVVTRRGHRRRGFGRAVLRRALEHAWGRGCYKVMLLTGRKDEGTYRFYESAGFDRGAKQAFLARPPET